MISVLNKKILFFIVILIILAGAFLSYFIFTKIDGEKLRDKINFFTQDNKSEEVSLQKREPLQKIIDILPSDDKDGDGLFYTEELKYGSDPTKYDTDNDGLSDKIEVEVYGTDPANADSDGDGYRDDEEIYNGYNPLGEGELNLDN